MTNAEKFVEVFGTDLKRQYATKSWWDQEFVPQNTGRTHGRKFEEIVVKYPPADLCTYTEYIGKPYFSIKYEENGEHIIGFGTYKPEVLSMYLREYFIAPTIIEADKAESEEQS